MPLAIYLVFGNRFGFLSSISFIGLFLLSKLVSVARSKMGVGGDELLNGLLSEVFILHP